MFGKGDLVGSWRGSELESSFPLFGVLGNNLVDMGKGKGKVENMRRLNFLL